MDLKLETRVFLVWISITENYGVGDLFLEVLACGLQLLHYFISLFATSHFPRTIFPI